MVKDIVTDNEILSIACEKATVEDASIIDDLLDTFDSLEDVACLAANQIGETKAIVVYLDEHDEKHVMLNPIMRQALHPSKVEEECFSHEGEPKKVTRFAWINVSFDELKDGKLVPRKQKFEGWTAQIIQHMIDHCKGKLV